MNFHGFGYTFPFPLMCSDNLDSWQPLSLDIDSTTVIIHRPFLSGNSTRTTPDFDLADSPSFKLQGISKSVDDLCISGFQTLPQCFSPSVATPPAQKACNAFQLEVHTRDENAAEKISEKISDRLIRQLRRLSQQFWIGRNMDYFEGRLKVQYRVENGKLPHEFRGRSRVYSGTTRMRVIDFSLWRTAAARTTQAPVLDARDSLLMADHHKAAGEYLEAIYHCAIAIEKSKYLLWQKIFRLGLCQKSKLKRAQNDTAKPKRYFGELVPDAIELALSKECLLAVDKAWLARGKIAHGKEHEVEKVIAEQLSNESVTGIVEPLWHLIMAVEELPTP